MYQTMMLFGKQLLKKLLMRTPLMPVPIACFFFLAVAFLGFSNISAIPVYQFKGFCYKLSRTHQVFQDLPLGP